MPSAYADAVRKTTQLVLARSHFLAEKKPRGSSPSIGEQLGQRAGTGFATLTTDSRNQRAYGYFRGWVYAIIHAVARRVATQPWGVGMTGAAPPQEEGERKRQRAQKNLMAKLKRWDCVKAIADTSDMEVLTEHPLLTLLNRPNPLQRKWDFLYLSAVNVMLTGECYWIASIGKDGVTEVWCVPTHWMAPKHEGGMFTSYTLSLDSVNKIELPAEAVARTYTPSPSDLRQAMSPLQAVISSVQIDDAIIDSQQQMFQRGIFPNLIVTVGRVPGADGKLTDRRWGLTMAQRSQVIRAIRQIWSQSVNAGDPAILDGMIESVHKLNSTSQEMDWLTSGEMVRKRVMIAFGVNAIALGDVQNANRAAAVVAEQSVCATSVNPLVSAFSETASVFFAPKYDKAGKLVVWLEPSEPIDPDLELSRWTAARGVGDVTRTEFRAEVLGLPPLEDEAEQQYRNPLMESVGGMQGAVQVLTGVSQGVIEPEAGSRLLQLFLQIPKKDADEIAGVGKEREEPAPVPQQEPPPLPAAEQQEEETEEEEGVGIEELGQEPTKGKVESAIKQVQRFNGLGLTRDDIKAVKADQTAKVQKEVGRVAAQYFQELRRICGGSGAEVGRQDG